MSEFANDDVQRVPSYFDYQQVADIGEIDEALRDAIKGDTRSVMELDEMRVDPYMEIYSHTRFARPFFEHLASLPEDHEALSDEDRSKLEGALLAGRWEKTSRADVIEIEQTFFENDVLFLIDELFNDHPETFRPEEITAIQFSELVDKVGQLLMDTISTTTLWGRPEGDDDAGHFMATLGGLVTMALASGSRLTLKRAHEWLEKFDQAKAPRGSVLRREAIQLEHLRAGFYKGDKTSEDLTNFKEGTQEDWPIILDAYMSAEMINECRKILSLVCGPQMKNYDYILAKDIKNAILARMELYREVIMLEARAWEIESLPSSIDEVLGPGEFFAQLDWKVFPAGEGDLEKAAREVVENIERRLRKGTKVTIDLNRLSMLSRVREDWGKDRSYFARGPASEQQQSDPHEKGESSFRDYIILVLQELDEHGNVITEHAVAESPAVGHSATYVYRGDRNPNQSWRGVFNLSRIRARQKGARAVFHTAIDGDFSVESTETKVESLLICTPEEFPLVRFDGKKIRVIRQIGQASLEQLNGE